MPHAVIEPVVIDDEGPDMARIDSVYIWRARGWRRRIKLRRSTEIEIYIRRTTARDRTSVKFTTTYNDYPPIGKAGAV